MQKSARGFRAPLVQFSSFKFYQLADIFLLTPVVFFCKSYRSLAAV